jgi:predicted GIY-YIG superfamily endonuclease
MGASRGVADGFTQKYGLKRLVYAEWHDNILAAKQREMNIKTLAARLEGGIDSPG